MRQIDLIPIDPAAPPLSVLMLDDGSFELEEKLYPNLKALQSHLAGRRPKYMIEDLGEVA